jgi:hypothetical protein
MLCTDSCDASMTDRYTCLPNPLNCLCATCMASSYSSLWQLMSCGVGCSACPEGCYSHLLFTPLEHDGSCISILVDMHSMHYICRDGTLVESLRHLQAGHLRGDQGCAGPW